MKVSWCALGMALAVSLLWGAAETLAQPSGSVPRIGVILARSASSNQKNLASLEQGLREHGWIAGQTLLIESRTAEGKPERYGEVAAELVRLKVSVIVAAGEPLIQAAKRASSSIPIVMAAVGDPVGAGFAVSLARPGGSITGVSNLAVGFPAKWLELLKETLPRLARVAVLRNLSNPTHDTFWRASEKAAVALGVKVVSIGIRGPAELEDAFARSSGAGVDAMLVLPDPITGSHSVRVADLALKHRLPSVFLFRENVEVGGFLSYGVNIGDNYRLAAGYVDKILRGANPGDLPIEQARQFDLVVNLRTARALGITIPQSLLLRADEVIQ
jgi:putative ABC transport system substrate-binding protein